jgi:diguanylate cyclase (GGDEF)-like protein
MEASMPADPESTDDLASARAAYEELQQLALLGSNREFATAAVAFEQLAERCGDAELHGWALVRLAAARHNLGDLQGSVEAARRAVVRFAGTGSNVGEARARLRIADASLALERVDEALDQLAHATACLARPSEPDLELVMAYETLAGVCGLLGAFEPALEASRHAVECARSLGDAALAGEVLLQQAASLMLWAERARACDEDALARSRLGQAAALLDEPEVAAACETMAEMAELGSIIDAAIALGRDDHTAALDHLEHVRGSDDDVDVPTRLLTELVRGRALLAAGRLDEADAVVERARRVEAETDEHSHGDALLRVAADIAMARGRTADAITLYRRWGAAVSRRREEDRHQLSAAVTSRADLLAVRRLADDFRDQAGRDPLTSLVNRRGLFERLADGRVSAGSVLVIDIDGFKAVNDRHGHDAGDAALRELARLVVATCRPDDLVVRYAGDEIVVVLASPVRESALALAERLRAVASNSRWSGVGERVTVSIGVAAGHGGFEALFAVADRHLLEVKRAGRNRVGG